MTDNDLTDELLLERSQVHGCLEERERSSSSGGKKKYKALTDKGLKSETTPTENHIAEKRLICYPFSRVTEI